MTKHFKAVHKESGEVVEFGLEDMLVYMDHGQAVMVIKEYGKPAIGVYSGFKIFLLDYEVFYFHEGEYYEYK